MYQRKSRLSARQRNRLVEHFVAGTTARAAADLVGVNRNTAVSFYHRLRLLIAEELTKACPLAGEVELDESYFGGRRQGPRGRGATGKVPVFGILKRGGRVYTTPIPNTKMATLVPIIKQMIVPASIVYTDTLPSYNALDVARFHYIRINHSTTFVDRVNHINGIENFWKQAKRHLRRFNGIRKGTFPVYLKECEWRFNGGRPKQLLYQLKSWVKAHSSKS